MSTLVQDIKMRTGSDDSEFSSEQVESFIEGALSEVSDVMTKEEILATPIAKEVLITRACIHLLYARMSAATLRYNITSPSGSTEESQVVNNCAKAIEGMYSLLNNLESKFQEAIPDIHVGTITRTDRLGRQIPSSASSWNHPVILTVAVVGNKANLSWTKVSDIGFSHYVIFKNESGSVTSIGSSSHSVYWQDISESSVGIVSLSPAWRSRYQVDNVEGVSYLVKAFSRGGQFVLSNEVTL